MHSPDKLSATASERMKRAHRAAAYDTWFRKQVQAAIDDVVQRMRAAVATITLPRRPNYGPSGEAAETQTLEVCSKRIASCA